MIIRFLAILLTQLCILSSGFNPEILAQNQHTKLASATLAPKAHISQIQSIPSLDQLKADNPSVTAQSQASMGTINIVPNSVSIDATGFQMSLHLLLSPFMLFIGLVWPAIFESKSWLFVREVVLKPFHSREGLKQKLQNDLKANSLKQIGVTEQDLKHGNAPAKIKKHFKHQYIHNYYNTQFFGQVPSIITVAIFTISVIAAPFIAELFGWSLLYLIVGGAVPIFSYLLYLSISKLAVSSDGAPIKLGGFALSHLVGVSSLGLFLIGFSLSPIPALSILAITQSTGIAILLGATLLPFVLGYSYLLVKAGPQKVLKETSLNIARFLSLPFLPFTLLISTLFPKKTERLQQFNEPIRGILPMVLTGAYLVLAYYLGVSLGIIGLSTLFYIAGSLMLALSFMVSAPYVWRHIQYKWQFQKTLRNSPISKHIDQIFAQKDPEIFQLIDQKIQTESSSFKEKNGFNSAKLGEQISQEQKQQARVLKLSYAISFTLLALLLGVYIIPLLVFTLNIGALYNLIFIAIVFTLLGIGFAYLKTGVSLSRAYQKRRLTEIDQLIKDNPKHQEQLKQSAQLELQSFNSAIFNWSNTLKVFTITFGTGLTTASIFTILSIAGTISSPLFVSFPYIYLAFLGGSALISGLFLLYGRFIARPSIEKKIEKLGTQTGTTASIKRINGHEIPKRSLRAFHPTSLKILSEIDNEITGLSGKTALKAEAFLQVLAPSKHSEKQWKMLHKNLKQAHLRLAAQGESYQSPFAQSLKQLHAIIGFALRHRQTLEQLSSNSPNQSLLSTLETTSPNLAKRFNQLIEKLDTSA